MTIEVGASIFEVSRHSGTYDPHKDHKQNLYQFHAFCFQLTNQVSIRNPPFSYIIGQNFVGQNMSSDRIFDTKPKFQQFCPIFA